MYLHFYAGSGFTSDHYSHSEELYCILCLAQGIVFPCNKLVFL